MTIFLDASLAWVKDLVVTEWPDGDEDALRQLAADWRTMGQALQTVQGAGDVTTRSVRGHIEGQVNDSIAEYWKRFGGDCGQLDALTGLCESQADLLEGLAAEVEWAKIAIIIELTALAITLIALAPAVVTGTGAAVQAARIVASRIVIRAILTRLRTMMTQRLVKAVWKNSLMSAGISSAFEAAVQGMERDFDPGKLLKAGATGAFAGAVTGAAGLDGALGMALSRPVSSWTSWSKLVDLPAGMVMNQAVVWGVVNPAVGAPDTAVRAPGAAAKFWDDVDPYRNFMRQLHEAATMTGRPR